MTESREVLIDAMLREWYPPAVDDMAAREDAMGRMALMDMSRLLDTLLAHPSAVLAALENAPCQTCGGDKFMRDAYGRPTEDDCSACGGSGKLGRDGVLRALGPLTDRELLIVADQAGWVHLGAAIPYFATDPSSQRAATAVFKSRPAVPPKLPADHSLCDLPCDLPDEAHG